MKADPKAWLLIQNRQRVRRVNVRYLRRIVHTFLREQLGPERYELGICLVESGRITRLNQAYLRHQGSTDVITFDYRAGGPGDWFWGDVFVNVRAAVLQAAQFRTTWQSELVRYVVHGILHLCGYDDRTARDRRRMKKEEDRWLRRLRLAFNFKKLAGNR